MSFRSFRLLCVLTLWVAGCGDPNPITAAGDAGGADDTGASGDGDGDSTPGDGDGNTGVGGDGDSTPGDGDGDSTGGDGCENGFGKVAGVCKADDGTACEADDDCVHGHCVAGVCCAGGCEDGNECQTPSCEDGATCLYDDIADCTLSNGGLCEDEADCASGHCVNGICCAQACDEPPACRKLEGTFCIDEGTVCDYGKLENSLDCSDEENVCTVDAGLCVNGECVADPITCDDSDASTDDMCDPEATGSDAPCVFTPVDCDDGNPCTDDARDSVSRCKRTDNANSCDDGNPCTVGDSCGFGVCNSGSAKNCDDSNICTNDSCSPSVVGGCVNAPNTNPCVKTSGGVNNCLLGDVCSGGTCTEGTTPGCGAGQTGCSGGATRVCECNTEGYTVQGDKCVEEACEPSPCDTNAICTGSGNCTCNAGYYGNGTPGNCTDINECTQDSNGGSISNPCGSDPCVPSGTPGETYTCSCPTNETDVGGECVCDLDGTWIVRIQTDLSWAGIGNVEDGTETTYAWAIRRHTYASDGTLDVETIPCGGTTPDLCGAPEPDGILPIPMEAYAQYLPTNIWGPPGVPSTDEPTITVPGTGRPAPKAGASFKSARAAGLLGIKLTDPFGAWPANRYFVQGTLRATGSTVSSGMTNGAVWQNDDSDGEPGVTTFAVPPGGVNISDGNPNNDPLDDYAALSPVCPRDSDALSGGQSCADDDACVGGWCDGANECSALPYNNWPFPWTAPFQAASLERVVEFYTGTRVISQLDGTIDDCSTITGDVTDGAGNVMKTDARVADCKWLDGGVRTQCSNALSFWIYTGNEYIVPLNASGGCPQQAGGLPSKWDCNSQCTAPDDICSGSAPNFFDFEPQRQQLESATFIMKRYTGAPESLTCAGARAFIPLN